MPKKAHAFVDGGYLRGLADDINGPWVDPHELCNNLCSQTAVQSWAADNRGGRNVALTRVTYYDARDDDAERNADIDSYCNAVELLPDTHLGFGWLRRTGWRGRREQKAVDTLIAVDMVVGAFTGLFDMALLLAGDADFVPVVDEVRRRGVMIALLADPASVADELKRSADRFVPFHLSSASDYLPLVIERRTWPTRRPEPV